MYPYQQQYQPMYREYAMAQGSTPGPVATAVAAAGPSGPSTGVKVVETLLTVGFTSAVVYTGVNAGMKEKGTKSAVGWVAGVGGAVLGLAAVAAIVSPPLASKINPFRFA